MAKYKHLTLQDRQIIESSLNSRTSFKGIGRLISKDCSTISKEVRSHLIFKKIGGQGIPYNNCIHRLSCKEHHICASCDFRRLCHHCSSCKLCNYVCKKFSPASCSLLDKPPYVCNGCKFRLHCSLEKRLYQAVPAQTEYETVRSESRTGITLTEQEVLHLNEIVSPLLRKNHSIHHICVTNPDSIMVSESTLYRLVDYCLFDARNMDLPRKVRFAQRKKNFLFSIPRFFLPFTFSSSLFFTLFFKSKFV